MSPIFNRLLEELTRAPAYPHATEKIIIVQTHISCVFLTGRFAYKIKKPVRFAFLDYSTRELRHEMCIKEVQLNRRLCPSVYLDVVPITEEKGKLRIDGDSEPVEWAVRMRQLSEAQMLSNRLKNYTLESADIQKVADTLASFHKKSANEADVRAFGSPESISRNIEENFEETQNRANTILPEAHLKAIEDFSRVFIREQKDLLRRRMAGGWIRDGHGDLRIQNICLEKELENGVQIFDCIEFNDRLRFLDIASDIGYLAMDLDLAGRADLRLMLAQQYFSQMQDRQAQSLLPFYLCYRAYVRGKIALFASEEQEIPEAERQSHSELAAAAFDLARSYTRPRKRPLLIIMIGLSGTGKSALAGELVRRFPAILLSSDFIRKQIAGVSLQTLLGKEWYTSEKISAVYEEMRKRARVYLQEGEIVILDATFLAASERNKAAELAAEFQAEFWMVESRCPEEVVRQRMGQRSGSASDADFSVYLYQKTIQEPVRDIAGASQWIALDTTAPADRLCREVLSRFWNY